MVWKFIGLVIVGYLLGNFNGARLISKLKKDDISKHGSGNPGTMNMLRTFGFGWGALTLFLDAAKGALASLAGLFLFGGYDGGSIAYIGLYVGGLSAIIGHCFPVFYKFKGGKGVACIVGMFAIAEPIWSAVMFVIAFLYLLIFKYGAITSFIFITVLEIQQGIKFKGELVICLLLLSFFCLTSFMHRGNFYRMLTGKEGQINMFKKKKGKIKISKKQKKQIKKENKAKEIG